MPFKDAADWWIVPLPEDCHLHRKQQLHCHDAVVIKCSTGCVMAEQHPLLPLLSLFAATTFSQMPAAGAAC